MYVVVCILKKSLKSPDVLLVYLKNVSIFCSAYIEIDNTEPHFLQISWIRYKDTSLLTVGRYTYTTDLRFEALHSPHTDDWIVRLKNPRPSDSGIYGCQISTTPHRTQLVYLTVHGKF